MKLTTQQVSALRNDLDEVLQGLCEKHHLAVIQSVITKFDEGCRLSLTFTVLADEGSEPQTRDLAGLARWGHLFGLTPDDLGQAFETHAGRLRFAGLRQQNQAVGARVDGRIFLYEPSIVAAKLRHGPEEDTNPKRAQP